MAQCKYCDVDDLRWIVEDAQCVQYKLIEPDGEPHVCNPKDKLKKFERINAEKFQTEVATRKYREANGYL